MSAVTRDGIEVAAGQVWRDLDKRMLGRQVTVIEVFPDAKPFPYAYVSSNTGMHSRIRIARMHKHGQGFALVPA